MRRPRRASGRVPARSGNRQTALADFTGVLAVNVTGVFLCTREAFRVMRTQDPQGGRIINNGSVSAHVPRPHAVAYTAAKHAVSG